VLAIRLPLTLTDEQGNLVCLETNKVVDAPDQLLEAKTTYEFQGDPSIFPIVPAEDAVLRRTLRTLVLIYALAWLTYFFLPRWTTTPALFFFMNTLATMLVDWSLKPTPAAWAPWLATTIAVFAHGYFAHWTCILHMHAAAALGLAASKLMRLSPLVSTAVFGAVIAIAWSQLQHCALKFPFDTISSSSSSSS
jgi:hypothetical protein